MQSIFLYDIGQKVYFINGFSISTGKIIGRKLVDAPNWKDAPSVSHENFNVFDMNGNRLGVPCEVYEVKFIDGSSTQNIVLAVDKLETSPEDVANKLLTNMSNINPKD